MDRMPRNLLIGESHENAAARQYVAASAADLREEGYVYFCYEMDSTGPVGDFFGLAANLTMQQVLNYVHTHLNEPTTVPILDAIEEQMDMYLSGHQGTGLGLMYRKVLEAGLQILCIDYQTKKLAEQKRSDEQTRVEDFDTYAIKCLAQLGHPWILLTGAHHLAAIQKATHAEIRFDFGTTEDQKKHYGVDTAGADDLLAKLGALKAGEESSSEEGSQEEKDAEEEPRSQE